MAEFAPEVWLSLGLIALTGGLALLHTLAAAVRHEAHIHDMRVRVATLRHNYAKQLAELSDTDEAADVIILPDPVPAPARKAA